MTLNPKAKHVPALMAEAAMAVVAEQGCLDLLQALKLDPICPLRGVVPSTS